MDLQFFDAHGNEVSLEDWAEGLVLGAIKATIEQYQQRAVRNVSRMTCLTHGGKARLKFLVSGSPEVPIINIEAISCCEEFSQQAIKEAYRSWATS